MRPPGYEPGELPTAPLRDISLFTAAKVRLFFEMCKFMRPYFVNKREKCVDSCVIRIKMIHLHTIIDVCSY